MPAQKFVKDDGTTSYTPLVEFANKAAREKFQAAAVRAVDAAGSMTYTIKAWPTMYKSTLFGAGWKRGGRPSSTWPAGPGSTSRWTLTGGRRTSWSHSHADTVNAPDLIRYTSKSSHTQNSASSKATRLRLHPYDTPSPAKFGNNPRVTEWEMAHGAGGGISSVMDWACPVSNVCTCADELWARAGNITRFLKPAGAA